MVIAYHENPPAEHTPNKLALQSGKGTLFGENSKWKKLAVRRDIADGRTTGTAPPLRRRDAFLARPCRLP
jgi:hypothetical protein